MRAPSEPGHYSISGVVYRDEYIASTEKDEWNPDNNVIGTVLGHNGSKNQHHVTELGPYLTTLTPNAAYREGTDVITSNNLINPISNNYTTDAPILVRIKIYDTYSGNLITELTKTTVVPAGETQLVYFKWNVPYLENYRNMNPLYFTNTMTNFFES